MIQMLCAVPEDHTSKKISIYNIFYTLLTDKPQ